MRLAIFSDIHGNQEALEAFIRDVSFRNVHRYLCLGDIVGYGANPNECIHLIRSLPKINFVLGNHDAAAGGLNLSNYMSKDAARAIAWTSEKLSPENTRFLKRLKPIIRMADMSFSHSTPYNPTEWHYVVNKEYAEKSFANTKEKLMFVGHVHISLIITKINFFKMTFDSPEDGSIVPVHESKRQIVVCGSVGQPRDGNPAVSYLIYDTLRQHIEFHRVEYNHQRAAAKIRAAGLPEFLASRLSEGA